MIVRPCRLLRLRDVAGAAFSTSGTRDSQSALPTFIDVENLLTTSFDDHRSNGVVLRRRRFHRMVHTD
jgi:hypothetical protein